MSKVAIFLADGFEEIEGLTVVDLLRRCKIEITTVSIMSQREVVGSHDIIIHADTLFEDMCFDEYDMLVLPGGGSGTERLEAFTSLQLILDDFYNKNKKIAAICAAPSILAHKGFLKETPACVYPSFEKELKDAVIVKKDAVVSENIITGRGMGCSIPFALAIIECLLGKQKAEELKQKIVYEQDRE